MGVINSQTYAYRSVVDIYVTESLRVLRLSIEKRQRNKPLKLLLKGKQNLIEN